MAIGTRSSRRVNLAIGLVVAALIALPVPVRAQMAHGAIYGFVIGPDDRPVDAATVTLLDPLGNALKSIATKQGEFRLNEIAPGTYSLRADAPPLYAIVQKVTVSTALPVQVNLRVTAVASEQVIVRGDELEPVSTTTRVTLAGDSVRRAPARLRSRGLQDAIATTPGWATEDNGLLHVRGVDDGFLYVIDGVPVYERLDGLFGVAPDPAMIDSVNVLTGYVPPEFGFKSGGVIEVRSATRAADTWTGTFDVIAGGDATRDVSSVAGGPLGAASMTVGLARQSSTRFLDPVHPENFHNNGHT
jgi:Carboxypeptidase regulatory-like domain/TonB-dependent Receptor Plug Domain